MRLHSHRVSHGAIYNDYVFKELLCLSGNRRRRLPGRKVIHRNHERLS